MLGIPLAELRDIVRHSRHTGIVLSAVLQRFGHSGIRSLLLIHLISEFKMSQPRAGQAYGLFYGSLALTALIGGFLGDTILGHRGTGALGLILMLVAQLSLAMGQMSGIILGLSIYSLGFGLFNPNMNAVVAEKYPVEDSLRGSAYTILYGGINLGMMLGPVVSGVIAAKTSWSYGILSGVPCTILALIVFARSAGRTAEDPPDVSRKGDAIKEEGHARGCDVAMSGKLVVGLAVGLSLLAFIFSGVFDQIGSSVTLLVKNHVRREFLNFEVPAGYVQSINPFLVIIFAPGLSLLIQRRGLLSSRVGKMKLLISGLLSLGTGFLLLSIGTVGITPSIRGSVSWGWILSAILLATLGELLFMPIAQALVAGLSPNRRRGLIMGAWAAGLGGGMYVSGMVSGFMSSSQNPSAYFAMSSGSCLLASVSLLLLTRRTPKQG